MSQPVSSTQSQSSYLPDLDQAFDALNRKACLCKLATKVTGCICLPVTYACCCITHGCIGNCSGERHPETHKLYSKFSSVETCVLSARLPPKTCSGRISQIWDPCVCLICCADETAEHYLSSEDQRQWTELHLSHQRNQTYLAISSAKKGSEPPAREEIPYVWAAGDRAGLLH